jgi:alpha-galactosidase
VVPAPQPATAQPVSHEAEGAGAVRSQGTRLRRIQAASGGTVVGFIGRGETLRFTVTVRAVGRYPLTIYYIAGTPRTGTLSVNGRFVAAAAPPATPDWYTLGSVTVPVQLLGGRNTIEFGNPRDFAPDIDRIVLG